MTPEYLNNILDNYLQAPIFWTAIILIGFFCLLLFAVWPKRY